MRLGSLSLLQANARCVSGECDEAHMRVDAGGVPGARRESSPHPSDWVKFFAALQYAAASLGIMFANKIVLTTYDFDSFAFLTLCQVRCLSARNLSVVEEGIRWGATDGLSVLAALAVRHHVRATGVCKAQGLDIVPGQ